MLQPRILTTAAASLLASAAAADVTLIGIATVPVDARDRSGLAGVMPRNIPNDRLASHGSAIAYTGKDDRYIMLADRGPGDGDSPFRCRYHVVRIPLPPAGSEDPSRPATIVPTVESTTLLSDEQGRPLIGISSAIQPDPADRAAGGRFDPEAVRLGGDGTLYIAEEYGPAVCAFSPEGRLLRRLPVPNRFTAAAHNADPALEMPPYNRTGRQPNRGFEGLALSADGALLLAAMQGPLIQDYALDAENLRIGANIRLLEIPVAGGPTRQWVYPLADPANGLNEILAVGENDYLVIERDGKAGADARDKKIVRLSTAGATDVSGVDRLPSTDLPDSIKPVKKTVFIDLLAPRHGISGPATPEKFEGLSFGPDLPDGRRTLLVTTDNDFRADQPTMIYIFAIDPDDLAPRSTW